MFCPSTSPIHMLPPTFFWQANFFNSLASLSWFKTTWKNSIHGRINPLFIFLLLILFVSAAEKKKSHNLKICSQSHGVTNVSSVFHCCCLSVNFYSDHVRISLVFLNFWTFSIISFYFLFSGKPFIFVLDLFPYCLSSVTLLHQLFSISSVVSISLPLPVPINFKYAQIVLRKKEKINQTKPFLTPTPISSYCPLSCPS